MDERLAVQARKEQVTPHHRVFGAADGDGSYDLPRLQ